MNARLRELYMVSRKEVINDPDDGMDSPTELKELDVVLKVDDRIVTKIQDLDVSETWPEFVNMTVLRNKKEMVVRVPTYELHGNGTSRVVLWAGAILHGMILSAYPFRTPFCRVITIKETAI
jgi:hypothetical protein